MSIDIGRAGEHIAAAALSRMKVQNVISQQMGFDIVAFTPQPRRIEVKTASRVSWKSKNHYAFMTSRGADKKTNLNAGDVDIVCLVALPLRCCVFKSIHDVKVKKLNLYVSLFNQSYEEQSWLETLESLR